MGAEPTRTPPGGRGGGPVPESAAASSPEGGSGVPLLLHHGIEELRRKGRHTGVSTHTHTHTHTGREWRSFTTVWWERRVTERGLPY